MPGFSFIYHRNGDLRMIGPAISTALNALIHDASYELKVLRQDDYYFLASTGYKEYPIEFIHCGDVSIYLEGYLYGTDSAARKAKLGELAELAFGADADERERTAGWLTTCDGDFVIILFNDKTGDVAIVNDVFSQLPLYCYRTPEVLVVSRELRFIAKRMNPVRFDRMALAEYLLFGFPLSAHTLLENVERFAPGTRLRIRRNEPAVHLDQLYQLNVESNERSQSSMRDNAVALVELFSQACRVRRLPGMEYVLSLSGGMDSRCVGGGLQLVGIPFHCVTFLDHAGNASRDIPVARRLAQSFEADWRLYELGPPTSRDVLRLLRLKNGMNPLGMAFLLPFLEAVRDSFELPVFFLTGGGFGGTLPDARSPISPTSLDTLVDCLIASNAKFSLQDVSLLTGFTRSDILDELRNHFLSYPEQACGEKYVHFWIAERGLKWHGEGEDRNRCYFWSTTPFNAFNFFKYVMACPDEQKGNFGLYREMLRLLASTTDGIEHPGYGAPVASPEFKTARRVAKLLAAHPERRKKLQETLGVVRRYDSGSMVLEYLTRQLADGNAIFEYLSADALRHTVEHYADHSAEEFDHLFTITSIIENLSTGRSVLEA